MVHLLCSVIESKINCAKAKSWSKCRNHYEQIVFTDFDGFFFKFQIIQDMVGTIVGHGGGQANLNILSPATVKPFS